MLPSSQRLRTSEVVEVLKCGRGLPSGRYLSAKMLEVSEPANATIRSAAVISKKVAKTAVMRNRVRRAVYDAFRAASGELLAASKSPTHLVLFVRSIPHDNLQAVFTEDIIKFLHSLAARR